MQVKSALVIKAKNVVANGRLQFDAGWIDMMSAFMAVKPHVTQGGTVTYRTSRAGDVGHGDLAWAVMHALSIEPLDGGVSTQTSTVEIFG